MWIPFFKEKETGTGRSISIHNEKTQKLVSKPSVTDLEQGYVSCCTCGEKMVLSTYSPLAISRCPSCDTPNFFPYKVKDYWLYEPLGGGGMGSVYHAFLSYEPEIEIAVKLLPRARKDDPYLIEALLREAETGFAFGDHPHLAKIIDMGFSNGEYFEALEYVEGVRLDRVIDSPVRRPESQIILWALQILSAEQHIFECGYLFRDLKPQNIIIDNSGNAKLVDYGLALSVQEAMMESNSDQIQGSPYYIPPERIVGAGESLCSEIYSLGMVVFHVLAKQPYYSSDEIRQLVGKHVKSLRISSINSRLPADVNPELITILSKMINRTPKLRYQTYKEVASDLYRLYKKTA